MPDNSSPGHAGTPAHLPVLRGSGRPFRLLADRRLTREGLNVILGLIVAVICWSLFLGVVQDLLANDPLVRADFRVMAIARTLRTPALNEVMAFVTYLGNWQVYGVAAAAFLTGLIFTRQWWWVAVFAASMVGEQLWSTFLKLAFDRTRPNLGEAVLTATGASFPSGHTLVGATFYGLLACYAASKTRSWPQKAGIAAMAAALLFAIGFSRVYLGVHWPTDVLASMALGPAWVATVLTVFVVVESRFPRHEARLLPPALIAAGILLWLAAAFAFYLTHPVAAMTAFAPKPEIAESGDFESRLLAIVPRFSETITGAPLVPLNLVMTGTEADLAYALRRDGWVEADAPGFTSGVELLLSGLRLRHDSDAPILPDFLGGRPSDLIFEKQLPEQASSERFVLQLWQPAILQGGLDVWAGTVHTERLGLLGTRRERKGIDPEIDPVRQNTVAGIRSTGCLEGLRTIGIAPAVAAADKAHPHVTDGKAALLTLNCPN